MTLQQALSCRNPQTWDDIAETSMLTNPSTMKIATAVVSLPQSARASIQGSPPARCSVRPLLLLNLKRADANARAAFGKSRDA
jgi:hypothetical protein